MVPDATSAVLRAFVRVQNRSGTVSHCCPCRSSYSSSNGVAVAGVGVAGVGVEVGVGE